MIWAGARLTRARHPLLIGWIGMIGIALLMHFGVFHLLSVLWRAIGINAKPIMQNPGAATSLSRFWGGRWNAAFHDVAHENLFKPVLGRMGARGALLQVFLVSGLVHELVISLPAHWGYGLPTIYFLLQGLAVLFERSHTGRKLGLGFGCRGWCFVVLVAGLPAFGLFHPVFVHRVILPMLHAIRAT